MKRVFLIVLDSFGCGAAPDAARFGDAGANTLRSCAAVPGFFPANLYGAGLNRLDGVDFLPREGAPTGAYGRLREASMGKDTTIGHWELSGVVSPQPLPTYPHGFPEEVLEPFRKAIGRGVLCNRPYSGTEVIRDYGRRHLQTGDLIVYTSADSVFQIAAHESIVPPQELYEYCRTARKILTGKHGVGRVIARPFTGEHPYIRTANRRDFSLEPPAETLLDALSAAGREVLAVGKIDDIFAGRGITETFRTHGNAEGMAVTLELAERDFTGLCFVNLVDFDMLYGHRQDAPGYARAIMAFDRWLPRLTEKLGQEDVLFITADHGCDPADASTDHTREYVPLLVQGKKILPKNLGTLPTLAAVAATAADLLGVDYPCPGESFAQAMIGRCAL